jgi:hypothetical protein
MVQRYAEKEMADGVGLDQIPVLSTLAKRKMRITDELFLCISIFENGKE